MALKDDLKQLIRPYYLVNIFLSLSFIVFKHISPLCLYVFPPSEFQCELNMRESEILFFLLFVVVMRARKTGSTTMLMYLTSGFSYCKVANSILWLYTDPRYGLIFIVLAILQAMMLPEPSYSGPEKVVYFRANSLEEEVERDRRVTWLIAFYTVWSPSCVNFAPIFSKLSADYTLDNLKFGKVDVGRYPEVAKKYYINDSSFSRQLPTVILFKNGEESTRRPGYDSRGQLAKFIFTEDNFKAAFDLNNLYMECKNNPIKERKDKRIKAE